MNDPVNLTDPLGLWQYPGPPIYVCGNCDRSPLLGGGNGAARSHRFQFDEPIQDDGGGTEGGRGGVPQDICSRPLSGSANRGQSVNSRRAQVRREIRSLKAWAMRHGQTYGSAISLAISMNVSRLRPNRGTWIAGGTSKPDGNYLYGAIIDELGIPLLVGQTFADFFEWADDLEDRLGLGDEPDESWGNADQRSRQQIRVGAQCPG